MRPVSSRFLETVARSHVMVTTCSVLYAGQTVVDSLEVVGGRITYNRRAAHLARLDDLTLGPGVLPLGPSDPVTPYGYELAIRRGVRYPDGTLETVGLGVFPVQRSSVDDRGRVRLALMDRSQRVSDARFEADYTVAAGTNYGTAIQALISSVVPGLSFLFQSVTHTTPALVFPAFSDPWAAAQSMATAIGCEVYFDGDGVCRLRTEPDLGSVSPVWTVGESTLLDPGRLVGLRVDLDRADAYNRVVAWSSNAALGQVFRGVATDDNPASPTYYFGPFGRKAREYASPLIGSAAQATSAALGILRAGYGLARSCEVTMFPNPALEPGDVVRVVMSRLSVDEALIGDVMTVGLGAEDPMTLSARTRQVT